VRYENGPSPKNLPKADNFADRLATEAMLQEVVLKVSEIVLLVVGRLTYKDQELIEQLSKASIS